MATKDQDKKLTSIKFLTSIKCVTNPQHNTPDQKLYCCNTANIVIYQKYSSNT